MKDENMKNSLKVPFPEMQKTKSDMLDEENNSRKISSARSRKSSIELNREMEREKALGKGKGGGDGSGMRNGIVNPGQIQIKIDGMEYYKVNQMSTQGVDKPERELLFGQCYIGFPKLLRQEMELFNIKDSGFIRARTVSDIIIIITRIIHQKKYN
jgi:hypothetical protein